ncbi:hypothetical protein A2311_05520 [candidate division WOR-1 bacterium RIFOXYB2_FULL_48_7]|uniref:Uncharacterized protein n=1 Tax=candidate division WOR-1 bacterium RIFOXYB2_FULL_48_7 TaxID=1802583 RepID=A0A1F4TPN8_UNCSA|nr:MAG: hypothetical protein A2311_05520 [candidate division WOR-1 bacterium RIFOXYB2_FULL_48_7]
MNNIKRIESNELKKIGRAPGATQAPPVGTPPVLRASWNFAWNMAKRFSQELGEDRTPEFLKNLIKKFS